MNDNFKTALTKFEKNKLLNYFIYGLGSFIILKNSVKFLSWIKKYFFTFPLNFKQKYGEGWVVISGGSDGIGKQFAVEFTKLGHKVLLIARNEEKLKNVQAQLSLLDNHKETKFIIYDFDKFYDEDSINELKSKLSDFKDISILINNVGTNKANRFTELENKEITTILNTNVDAGVHLTRIVLEKMEENKETGDNDSKTRKLVVGVGSIMAQYRTPYSVIYNGSKSFVEAFYESISHEYNNIDFTYLQTGSVLTNLNKGEGFGKVSAEAYVRHTMSQIGRYQHSSGHYLHSIWDYFIIYAPFSGIFHMLFRNYRKNVIEQKLKLMKEEKIKKEQDKEIESKK